MDYFLDDEKVYKRLLTEYEKYDNIIVAYDYDNTVYDYHNEGHSYDDVITLLQDCRDKLGAKFVVFTACDESKYASISEYLVAHDVPFDTINENLSCVPFNGRKIYYNILLDDRAGLSSAYNVLKRLVHEKGE